MKDRMIIGIAGGGKMGTDLFYYFTGKGFPVKFYVRNATRCSEILHKFDKKLRRQFDNSIISDTTFSDLSARCEVSPDLNILGGADLLIETVSETRQAKADFYTALKHSGIRPALVASNSSSIPVGELMDFNSGYPVLGLHFFYPVALHPFVELVLPDDRNVDTPALVKNLIDSCGLQLLILPHSQPFLLNRIFLEMQAEAFRWGVEFSVSPNEIDAWCTAQLFPLGLFNMVENVGREVMAQSIANYLPFSINKYAVQMFYQYVCAGNRLDWPSGNIPSRTDFFNRLYEALQQVYYEAVRKFALPGIPSEEKIHLAMADFVGLSGNRIFEP